MGVSQKMTDNMTTVLERGDTINVDNTLIKKIKNDFLINPCKFVAKSIYPKLVVPATAFVTAIISLIQSVSFISEIHLCFINSNNYVFSFSNQIDSRIDVRKVQLFSEGIHFL